MLFESNGLGLMVSSLRSRVCKFNSRIIMRDLGPQILVHVALIHSTLETCYYGINGKF